MAFEYNGKVYLNLEEQVEVNSKMAVDAKETAEAAEALVDSKADITYVDTELAKKADITYVDTELAKKVTKEYVQDYAVPKTTLTYKVYGTNQNGAQVALDFAGNSASANSIARRTSGGQLFVADPTAKGHAATKEYVDDRIKANPTDTATTDLKKLKVGRTTYNIPSGGGSAGVSSIDGATGAILIGGGLTRNGQRINGPDLSGYVNKLIISTEGVVRVYSASKNGAGSILVEKDSANADSIVQRTQNGRVVCASPTDNNHAATKKYVDDNFAPKATNGYVEKQTTTSGSWRAYVYNNTGDNSLLVISGGDGTFAPTATGNIVATTSGRIRTNTPTGPYHAANKGYVDDLVASAVVDFNGYNLDAVTTTVGLKVYAAMQTFGFFVPKHTGDGTIFGRPLTDSEVTIPTGSFAFSIVQATSSGMKDSYINNSGLYYIVDSSGNITMEV